MSQPHLYPSLLRRLALLDYPLPLKLHAYLLLGLGTALTFAPQLVVGNALFTRASRLLGVPPEVPAAGGAGAGSKVDGKVQAGLAPAARRNLSVAGLLAFGLGLAYVGTSLFADSPKQNQLLYAALPLRFVMSASAIVSWLTDPPARSVFKATVIFEDALGAVWLAYVMRDWPLWQTFRW